MTIKKKGHPTFNIPNYGTKSRKRVPKRWRKQRGIDNKKRVKKDFMGAEPTIGYRNPEAIRGIRVNGKRIALIHNTDELKRLVASGDKEKFDVTIAGAVSTRKRIAITELARSHKIAVTNGAFK
jgi:large subunit ribosomal protein L32e